MAIIDSGNIKIIVDMPNKKLEKKVEKVVTGLVRPLPFECEILNRQPLMVKNNLSGEEVELEPDAVAVFDSVKGAELIGEYEKVRQGCAWFRKYFPKEYMVLLD